MGQILVLRKVKVELKPPRFVKITGGEWFLIENEEGFTRGNLQGLDALVSRKAEPGAARFTAHEVTRIVTMANWVRAVQAVTQDTMAAVKGKIIRLDDLKNGVITVEFEGENMEEQLKNAYCSAAQEGVVGGLGPSMRPGGGTSGNLVSGRSGTAAIVAPTVFQQRTKLVINYKHKNHRIYLKKNVNVGDSIRCLALQGKDSMNIVTKGRLPPAAIEIVQSKKWVVPETFTVQSWRVVPGSTTVLTVPGGNVLTARDENAGLKDEVGVNKQKASHSKTRAFDGNEKFFANIGSASSASSSILSPQQQQHQQPNTNLVATTTTSTRKP